MYYTDQLNEKQTQCECLSEESKWILTFGIRRFKEIIPVLEITGRIIPNECRDLLFENYEQNILLYKVANELLRLNKEAALFYQQKLVKYKDMILESLVKLRKIINYLKLTGNVLSDNYAEDIYKICDKWESLLNNKRSFFEDTFPDEVPPKDKDPFEMHYYEEESDWTYEKIYGKIEFEDEYTVE